jgi:2-polyprenyl-3-methyl-5-hydroxy-6-metoxy-1,4-benzoquinol methylase
MEILPPGTILQLQFLRKRLQKMNLTTFIEVGPGRGEITKLLLDLGMKGISFEIASESVEYLRSRFAKEIQNGKLIVSSESFLNFQSPNKVDCVISSMVLEHLPMQEEKEFVIKSGNLLSKNGIFVALVPANMKFWGIEDEIAGHYRRYDRHSLLSLLKKSEMRASRITGLTFPLSNFLLPLSNFLVKRSENVKLEVSLQERTLLSGHREVVFKTRFPIFFKVLLNKYTLSPFYFLQWCFQNNSNCLILCVEAEKI